MSERETTTFDFEGPVESSSFTDIDSTADTLVRCDTSRGNGFDRIRHQPFRTDGALTGRRSTRGLVALFVAVGFGFVQAL